MKRFIQILVLMMICACANAQVAKKKVITKTTTTTTRSTSTTVGKKTRTTATTTRTTRAGGTKTKTKTSVSTTSTTSNKTQEPEISSMLCDETAMMDEDDVYEVVDQQPSFKGGMERLMTYLGQNLKYPVNAAKNGIQGRVICQFIVNKDGSITEVTVKKSVDAELDAEAVRVIKAMPNWTPGRQRGKEVRVRFTLPIMFRLQAPEKEVEQI